jgi:hypothetical protein
VSFLKKMFAAAAGYFRSGKAERDLSAIRSMVPKAIPIIEAFAAMTPTRADDELVVLFRKYGLPGIDRFLELPLEKRGLALLDGASVVLGRTFPGAAARLLNASVQLAYTAWRAEQE